MNSINTGWFPEHLQNSLTPGVAALMRAWLVEACQINGRGWTAESLMQQLPVYVLEGMDEKDLGQTLKYQPPMPTDEEIKAAFPSLFETQPASEPQAA